MANLKKRIDDSKMGRVLNATTSLWSLIESISEVKSSEGMADKDTLETWYRVATDIANMLHEGIDDIYSASTKKSKVSKSSGLDRVLNDLMNISDAEASAVDDACATYSGEYQLDFENLCGFIQLASDYADGKRASTKKSKLSKEYRVNTDRDIDIDIMAGELTVRVSDVQSGWARNKQIDVMNLPWQIVGNINEILGENWDEIPQFVAIENSLVERYDEHWQEVDRQLHEQNGWKSTKKSIQKPINNTMSFEDNVNKMRKSNYDRTGNINTIIKERR